MRSIFRPLVRSINSVVKASNSMAYVVSAAHDEAESVAINLLKTGKVIAVPTDTLYGLACSATNVDAINKLYAIKRRNENKPIAICVGRVCDVEKWAYCNHLPDGVLSALLPGPVTLVLQCINKLDKSVSYNGKVGIRIPDCSFIRNVANGLNCPLALTSANISSEKSSVRVEEFQPLWNKVGAVFDGGCLGSGDRRGSTIIDLSIAGYFRIIREGVAAAEVSNILTVFGLKEKSQ